ncbi:hypothetical protein BDQ17DRAFT_1377648 [Cyathus striatus]|nr:hypothetical protein BDQ17DRAFT_1381765 [Cyathus striatus]KAF8984034.1 hypothetical protein BDQ17DRAFT_1377648 [Cyathus striatus]
MAAQAVWPDVDESQCSEIYELIHEDIHDRIKYHDLYCPYPDDDQCSLSRKELIHPIRYYVLVTVGLFPLEYLLFHWYMILSSMHLVVTAMITLHYKKMAKRCCKTSPPDPKLISEEYGFFERLLSYWAFSRAIVVAFFVRAVIFAAVELPLPAGIVLSIFMPTIIYLICCVLDKNAKHFDPYSYWFGSTVKEKWGRWISFRVMVALDDSLCPPKMLDPALSFALTIPVRHPFLTLQAFLTQALPEKDARIRSIIINSYRWDSLTVPNDFLAFLPSCAHMRRDTGDTLPISRGPRDLSLLYPLIMLQRANAFDHRSIKKFSNYYIAKVLKIPDSLELIAEILPNAFIAERLYNSVGAMNICKEAYEESVRAILATMYLEAFLPLHSELLSRSTIRCFITALDRFPEGNKFLGCFLDIERYHIDWSDILHDESMSIQILQALTRHVIAGADFTFAWLGLRVFIQNFEWNYRTSQSSKATELKQVMLEFLKAVHIYLLGLTDEKEIGKWLTIFFTFMQQSTIGRTYWLAMKDGVYDEIVAIIESLHTKFPMKVLEKEKAILSVYRIESSIEEEK